MLLQVARYHSILLKCPPLTPSLTRAPSSRPSRLPSGHPNIVHTYKCLASWRDLSGPDQGGGMIKVS